jgi:hypothetical protein
MKKYFFLAVLATAVIFTSCSKEETPSDQIKATIRLAGISSRAIEAPAPGTAPGETPTGTITLRNGHVFVINQSNVVTSSVPLNVTEAQSVAGQEIGGIPSTSRIYVVGNIPATLLSAVTGQSTLNGILTLVSDIEVLEGYNYTGVVLANNNGLPAVMDNVTAAAPGSGNYGTADVSITLSPLISRLELVQVQGAGNILSFDVTGVFVDDYHTGFTWSGGNSGNSGANGLNFYTHGQATPILAYAPWFHDAGEWPSDNLVATPATVLIPNAVWAYNLPSRGLPRLFIRLENVTAAAGFLVDPNKVYYVTVTGYTGLGSATFERGKIYRIGGANGITFDETQIAEVPNPDGVDLTLTVLIQEWQIVTPGAVI